MKLNPADAVLTRTLIDDSVMYYYHTPPNTITSFETALNTALWRCHYQSFSCVIINPNKTEIILVRDHLGLSPLYYYHQKQFLFSDTISKIIDQLPSTPAWCDNQILTLFSENKQYSDETYYQHIYRVEPGHIMHFKASGAVIKKAFWQLAREGELLQYKNDDDYVDHFSELFNESILNATSNQKNMAAEFSAGLDSSAVYCAARKNNINPALFMHTATPNTPQAIAYNHLYEKKFIEYYQLNNITRVGVEDFDPLAIFKEYAQWFAGPAPYLYFMFSNKLHCAVSREKHPILLSGFGGDQCVSGQIPLNFCLPKLINQGQYQEALREIGGKKRKLIPYLHPHLYSLSISMQTIRNRLRNAVRDADNQKPFAVHPYQKNYYPTVRHAEWDLLQGPMSHEVRMRIEYSSIVSKKLGFEYRYPLLYPKLLEFVLSVPLSQKRRNGRGRYLIHRYLSRFFPIFDHYKKQEGLGIVPSTFHLYQEKFQQGCYDDAFRALPYSHLIKNKQQAILLRNCVKGIMLKYAMEKNR